MIDSPYKTLEVIETLKDLTKHLRTYCRDKNYAGSINFNYIIKCLEEQEEVVMDSIKEWEDIMNEV